MPSVSWRRRQYLLEGEGDVKIASRIARDDGLVISRVDINRANYRAAAVRSTDRQGQCHSDAAVAAAAAAGCKKMLHANVVACMREYPVAGGPSYRIRPSSTYAHVHMLWARRRAPWQPIGHFGRAVSHAITSIRSLSSSWSSSPRCRQRCGRIAPRKSRYKASDRRHSSNIGFTIHVGVCVCVCCFSGLFVCQCSGW